MRSSPNCGPRRQRHEPAAVEVRRRQALPVTGDQIELWEAQATRLANSDLVKGGYRNRPENIIAAAMIGAELGWSAHVQPAEHPLVDHPDPQEGL